MCPNISTYTSLREGSMLVTMSGSGAPSSLMNTEKNSFTVKKCHYNILDQEQSWV